MSCADSPAAITPAMRTAAPRRTLRVRSIKTILSTWLARRGLTQAHQVAHQAVHIRIAQPVDAVGGHERLPLDDHLTDVALQESSQPLGGIHHLNGEGVLVLADATHPLAVPCDHGQ